MPNAATLLADFLEDCLIADQTTTSKIRTAWASKHDLNLWEAQRLAAELLLEVEQALDDLAANSVEVGYLLESLEAWTKAVFVPSGWNTSGAPKEQIDNADLRFLRGLAATIDQADMDPEIDAADLQAVSEVVTGAVELLDESDLPHEIKLYVRGLLSEAGSMLANWEFYSGGRFRKFVIELSGAMHVAADEEENSGEPERAQRWRTAARRIVDGALGSVLGQAAIQAGQAARELPSV